MSDRDGRRGGGARNRRKPLKATPEKLERSALYYLDRYDSSTGHLRRLLQRKIALSARVHGTDPQAGAAAAEQLITRLVDLGLLDDTRYARERVRSLRARGASAALIRHRLRAKSLPDSLIDAALGGGGSGEDGCEGDGPGRELRAALRYAQRRRLGPYRPPENRTARRDRDLAALGRQGFDYETARRVIDCDDPETLALKAGEA